MVKSSFAVTVIGLLLGCIAGTANAQSDWRERAQEDARKPGVMAQFCVLQTAQPGFLHASNVHREGRAPRSINSTLSRYLGISSTGQFIFQSYLGKLEEFTAVVIFPESPEQQIFLSQKSLYSDRGWSKWVPPDLVSADGDISFKLLYGRKYEKDGQGLKKILARFRVGSYAQWRNETDDIGLRSDLEACPLTPNPSLQEGPAVSGRPSELPR